MSTLFTLAGCVTYTFVIITTIILITKLVRAFREYNPDVSKAMLFYELCSVLLIGTSLGLLFQNYGRFIA